MITLPPIMNGHYVLHLDAQKYDNEIFFDIKKIGKYRIKFQGQSYWQGADPENIHTGAVAAIVNVKNNHASYVDRSDTHDGCKIELTFLKKRLDVTDNNSCGGVNVTFTGEYTKK